MSTLLSKECIANYLQKITLIQTTRYKKSDTFGCINTVCWRWPTLPFEKSTIGARKLNFRVRNENGCTLSANSPTYKIHTEFVAFFMHILFSTHFTLHKIVTNVQNMMQLCLLEDVLRRNLTSVRRPATYLKQVQMRLFCTLAVYNIPYGKYVLLVHLG